MDTNGNTNELLIKDLSSRLPYGVIVNVNGTSNVRLDSVSWYEEISVDDGSTNLYHISEVKPYLFPLSSMTEEQKSQYNFYLTRIVFAYDASLLIDWLNKNHFDYRNLINKNLAIDCTNLNIY